MKLTLIAVGNRMPDWVIKGYNEYQKRLPPEFAWSLIEIPLASRSKSSNANIATSKEGDKMLSAIPKGDRVVALDVLGKPWDTHALAGNLEKWSLEGGNTSLLVGGPDGLAAPCLERADMKWSLSPLTLPHPLVRVLLVEQIYRAWSINAGHPYHR